MSVIDLGMHMKRVFVLSACLFLAPTLAFGAPGTDKDRARELAQDAADLLDEKKYAKALELATKAESLYHAVYHLYVAARSLEGLGRMTESVEMYERVLAEPLPASAPQVFRDAQIDSKAHMSELLARIPTVLVRLTGLPTEGVTATLDNKSIDLPSGVAMRADPGSHVVRVTAEGRIPFETTISLPKKGGVIVVDVALQPVGTPTNLPPDGNPSEGTIGPDGKVIPGSGRPGKTLGGGNSSGGTGDLAATPRASFTPTIVGFGVGAAGLVFGSVMGALQLGQVGQLEKLCPNKVCPPDAQPEFDKAHQFATLSTVGFVVGGAGVAAGAVLLVLRKKTPANSATGAFVIPWVGPGTIGLAGTF